MEFNTLVLIYSCMHQCAIYNTKCMSKLSVTAVLKQTRNFDVLFECAFLTRFELASKENFLSAAAGEG